MTKFAGGQLDDARTARMNPTELLIGRCSVPAAV